MTIVQLQYILAVSRHGSFTTAAEKCFVTQPTLSMQIQKLEEQLGIQIFDRNKKPITLTPIGRKIVEQARTIVDEATRMRDIIEQEKGMISGEFRIGIIPTIMPTLLPLFLKTYLKKYTKVSLHLEEMQTTHILSALKDGSVDAGIAATPLEEPEIQEKPLYLEPIVGFVTQDSPLYKEKKITPVQFSNEELLLLEDGHCFRDNVLNMCGHTLPQGKQKFRLASGNFDTLIKLSTDGFGVTALPYLATFDMREEYKKNIREFIDPVPVREVSLIYHQSQLKMQVIDSLAKTIQGIIKGMILLENVKLMSPLPKNR